MSKKLNKTEITTLAKRILEEVNEVNQKYNESVKISKVYLDEVKKIEGQNPLIKIDAEIEKLLKVEFGTDYTKFVKFTICYGTENWKIADKIKDEIKELNNKSFKKLYHVPDNNYDRMWNNQDVQKVIDDITIAQIDITDIHLLINTIKAKLI